MNMSDLVPDDPTIKEICKDRFGIDLNIAETILRAVPVSASARANVFLTNNHQMYVLIASQSAIVLDDVRKIIVRMQCEAEEFLPPHCEEEYFDRIARAKYKIMFPGKRITGEDDLRYYKSLAPYNPALVRISKIKGEIRGYDAASKLWRKVKDYTYSRIQPK